MTSLTGASGLTRTADTQIQAGQTCRHNNSKCTDTSRADTWPQLQQAHRYNHSRHTDTRVQARPNRSRQTAVAGNIRTPVTPQPHMGTGRADAPGPAQQPLPHREPRHASAHSPHPQVLTAPCPQLPGLCGRRGGKPSRGIVVTSLSGSARPPAGSEGQGAAASRRGSQLNPRLPLNDTLGPTHEAAPRQQVSRTRACPHLQRRCWSRPSFPAPRRG